LLETERRFVVAFFDLDAFKPFNDVYGTAQGDQVILHLAGLLKSTFSPRLDFIGHIGGDDFLVVMRSADWRERTTKLLEEFSASVTRFYSAEHAQLGHIVSTDRDGAPRHFPFLTLSVAALYSETLGATSADAIAQQLAHVKKVAKQRPGNSFVLRMGERMVDLLPAAIPTAPVANVESDVIVIDQIAI
jgi:GGDEF domain-containing protein